VFVDLLLFNNIFLFLGNGEPALHFMQGINCALDGIITYLKLVIIDGKASFSLNVEMGLVPHHLGLGFLFVMKWSFICA
jgi:hypothetical protein